MNWRIPQFPHTPQTLAEKEDILIRLNDILYLREVDGLQLKEIAKKFRLSYSRIQQLHVKARAMRTIGML